MKDADNQDNPFGAFAEQLAAEHLLTEGYIIVARNWRPKNSHLEVDIIARQDDTIIFAEVKARGLDSDDPADAVDEKKQRRLARAAERYLACQPYDFFYRFDIITVTGDENEYTLEHFPDAFLGPLVTY